MRQITYWTHCKTFCDAGESKDVFTLYLVSWTPSLYCCPRVLPLCNDDDDDCRSVCVSRISCKRCSTCARKKFHTRYETPALKISCRDGEQRMRARVRVSKTRFFYARVKHACRARKQSDVRNIMRATNSSARFKEKMALGSARAMKS